MAGSGKSTLARALATRSGLPLIHLDLQFWKPGWVQPTEAEWREKQRDVLAGNAWIADGNYSETLDLRLERADTVVVLATPWWRCAGRAFLRGFRMPDQLPEGSEYEWRLIPLIWGGRRADLACEQAIIAEHGQHATRHVLKSKRAIRQFLDGFGADHRPTP
jgi:adenylate kinase family enzyme